MRDFNNPQNVNEICEVAPLVYADLSKTATMVIVAEHERVMDVQRQVNLVESLVRMQVKDLPEEYLAITNYLHSMEQAFQAELFKRYCKEYQLDKAIEEGILEEYDTLVANPHFEKWVKRHREVRPVW